MLLYFADQMPGLPFPHKMVTKVDKVELQDYLIDPVRIKEVINTQPDMSACCLFDKAKVFIKMQHSGRG